MCTDNHTFVMSAPRDQLVEVLRACAGWTDESGRGGIDTRWDL
jgi:hypothetical protein